jgi:AraC-like DNA-binding protein
MAAMNVSKRDRISIGASGPTSSAVDTYLVDEIDHDSPRVALPRPEIQIVIRFGPSAREGLDVHALGMQQTVRRKIIRRGRAVTARLRLGTSTAVLGVPASVVAGSIVALDELWGSAAAAALQERLSRARDMTQAVQIVESAVAQRLANTEQRDENAPLALAAAARLANESVRSVASDIGVSERHLRRVFHQTLGVSPKDFSRLARFRRAVHLAREGREPSWAAIAATAGYYDQAHLIADFRRIGGATPRALLSEIEGRAVSA